MAREIIGIEWAPSSTGGFIEKPRRPACSCAPICAARLAGALSKAPPECMQQMMSTRNERAAVHPAGAYTIREAAR